MTANEAYDDEDVDARLAAARGEQTELCIDELPWHCLLYTSRCV